MVPNYGKLQYFRVIYGRNTVFLPQKAEVFYRKVKVLHCKNVEVYGAYGKKRKLPQTATFLPYPKVNYHILQ